MFRTIGCTDTDTGEFLDPCKGTTANCNSFLCPDDPNYTKWQPWTECSVQCGQGDRSRTGVTKSGQDKTEQIICNPSCESGNPQQECGIANLVFILDSSQSVGELNWFKIKQFAIDVISGLTVSEQESHVGVVLYATDVEKAFDLNSFKQEKRVQDEVWKLPYKAGATSTTEAIGAMTEIMAAGRRDDAKDIAILLSDGVTNIRQNETMEFADKAKDDGITIFSIGVTNEINEDELRNIASDPKYFTYVENFDDLQKIISMIIEGTCEITNEITCSNWGPWGTCSASCGGGSRSRERRCRVVDSNNQTIADDIVRNQEEACNEFDCTTTPKPTTTPEPTTPEPTTTPKPTSAPVDCSKCFSNTRNDQVYLPDPDNCQCFYQCERFVSSNGFRYIRHDKCCPAGTYWSQQYLTCVPPFLAKLDECTVVQPTTAAPTTAATAPACALQEVPNEPHLFMNGRYKQTCGPYMVFSSVACTCVPGGAAPNTCDRDVLLYFPFESDLNDHSCNRAVSSQTDYRQLVTLVNDNERGTVASFAGRGSLDVGFINNYFAGRKIYTWSVALWFKKTGGSKSGYSGLVNNGDCDGLPSFDMHCDDGPVMVAGVRTAGQKSVVNTESVSVQMNSWEHVAMVYDSEEVRVYLNGKQMSAKANKGYLGNTHCPMNIGADHPGSGHFTGLMDNIYVYDRVLSDSEVTSVMNFK